MFFEMPWAGMTNSEETLLVDYEKESTIDEFCADFALNIKGKTCVSWIIEPIQIGGMIKAVYRVW